MMAMFRDGYDVIGAVRTVRRGENVMKLFTAAIFYRLLRATTRLDISSGSIALPSGPGLGIELDEQKLARYALPMDH
jgi:L-alanine-DL-glutamate epimerase-like enolase superfamily enzyme